MAGIDDYTVLMLHGDGSNGSTTITDSSLWGRTVTPVGNAQISTAQSKFGGSCIAFDGTGDWLTVPKGAQMNFQTSDFTIETWVRFNSVAASQSICSTYNPTDGGFVWYYYQPNGNMYFEVYTNSSNISVSVVGNWSPSANTWYHVAITRSGNSWRLFVNGSQIGSTTTDADPVKLSSTDLQIGTYNTGTMSMNGYIDEFRVSRNIARWTSNFTPETNPYSEDDGNVYMAVFDGTNDYMRRGADLTGISDSNKGFVSFWFTCNAGPTTYNYIIGGPDSNSVAIGIYGGQMHFLYRASAGTNLALAYTTRTDLSDGNPHHVAFSFDLSTGAMKLFVDGVDDLLPGYTATSGTVDFTRGNFYISDHVGLYKHNGKLGQVIFSSGTYVNLTNDIGKFYNSINAGPKNVGYDGSAPFGGTVPPLYLGNEYNAFQTNIGGGGNFTLTGALTEGGNVGAAPIDLSIFDGTNDYGYKASDLSSNADGKQGIFSCWFVANNNGNPQYLLSSDNSCLEATVDSGGAFYIFARSSAISTVLYATTGAFTVNDGNLHHVVTSWDLATGYVKILIDGVDRTAASPTIVNTNIDYTRANWRLSGNGAGSYVMNGKLGQMYFNNTTVVDLTVQANVEKYIKYGRPVYMGALGSIPTGSQPTIYLRRNYKSFVTTNEGYGGNFALTGALDNGGFITTRSISFQGSAASYTMTGNNAGLTATRTLPCSVGSYTLTGVDATLRILRLTASVGAYSITGQSASLLKGSSLTSAVGSYSITGVAAGLSAVRMMPSAVGSYTLTGQSAGTYIGKKLLADSGTFTETGQSAGLFKGFKIAADTGAYTPKPRTNLVRQSQTLGTTWTKTRTLVVDNATTAPDGTTTAEKVTCDSTANSTHQISQAPASPYFELGKTYTCSIYAKAAEHEKIRMTFPTAVFGGSSTTMSCYFDLINGVITNKGSAVDAGIEDAGNGWYRCWLTGTVGTITGDSGDRTVIWLIPNGTTTTYDGDGTSGVYLWGAQWEEGTLPTEYIPTTTVAVTSYDHYADLIATRQMQLAQGSYNISGQDAGLLNTRKITGAVGSYSIDGQDNDMRYGRIMPAAHGEYTITGIDASKYAQTYIRDRKVIGVTAFDPVIGIGVNINVPHKDIEVLSGVSVYKDAVVKYTGEPVPQSHMEDARKLEMDAYVELFEIQLSDGATKLFLKADKDGDWQGNTYEGTGIKIEGVGTYADDEVARPKLTLWNPEGVFSALIDQGAIDNATVTRIRILKAHYEDNMPIYRRQQWRVARVASLRKTVIGLELRDMLDGQNFQVPGRMFIPPDFPTVSLN